LNNLRSSIPKSTFCRQRKPAGQLAIGEETSSPVQMGS
jgi:hypothetical protein